MLKNLHNQQSAPAQSHSSWRVAGISVALLLISACAAAPIAPTAELQAAESAIKAAEQARVADYASPDLAEARNKLNAANASLQLKEMDMARRLAEQARVGKASGIPHQVVQKNGDLVRLAPGKPGKLAEVRAGRLVLDGDIIAPANGEAITMRRRIAAEGGTEAEKSALAGILQAELPVLPIAWYQQTAAISATVNNQPPSPAIANTGLVGAAMLAPIAIGSAQPSVPKPYGASHDRERVAGNHQCAL